MSEVGTTADINEIASYTEYNVTTPTADFAIGFDYEEQSDTMKGDAIVVTINRVDPSTLGYTVTLKNKNTVNFSPSVPSGNTVRLQRETDIDTNLYTFSAGALFVAKNVDSDFEQIRKSQQEVRDKAGDILDYTEAKITDYDSRVQTVELATAKTQQDLASEILRAKNVEAGLQSQINNTGNINTITPVKSVADLSTLSVWDNRTAYVQDVGIYRYSVPNGDWIRDFTTDRSVQAVSDLSTLPVWNNKSAYKYNIGMMYYNESSNAWQQDVIKKNALNLLDFIPIELHQYISDYTNARNNFDAYPYLKECEAVALTLNKPIYVPTGYYPLSQTYVQPNFINITGDLGRTWFIPTKEFPEKTWLWEFGLTGMTATSLNDVCFQGNDKNSDSAYYGGLLLSKRAWFCNIKNIRFMNLSYGGLLIAPRYNPSESGVPDLVNLNIDNLFFLDCGSSQYYPTFDINLTADSATSLSGNWTDGSVKNIDIACADGDQQNTRGGIGFRLRTKDVTLFNVVFDRFFIGTRLQSHTYIDAPLMNGNTFSNFSGETHNTIYNGQGVPIDYTYQHNWENLGQWNTLQNINSNMSLGDLGSMQKGLYLNNSYSNTISNMPLNASYANNQLELLNITSNANLTTFDNCNVRLLENKDWNIAWGIINNLFTNTIIDKGINTKFNGQQVNSNAIKERALSYYSNLNSAGTAPINAQTGSGYDGLSFSQDSNTKSLSVTLASSTSTRQRNIYYVNKRSGKKVYYVVLRVKQTSGSLSNNYIEIGMFDQSYKKQLSALNTAQEFVFVFNNTNAGVDALVIALGNSASTTDNATFLFDDIYVSANNLPYKPNYTVVSES